MSPPAQTIRYATTREGVRLAWAVSGSGPALVKTANWITHLEYDWESPAWRHWIAFLSAHFCCYRYDERGCGLSDRQVEDVSARCWLPDLEDVIGAAHPPEPFILFGLSQGACAAIEFAARYPQRVSHLVIYGGYAKGWARRGNPDQLREGLALVELTELGWGRADPLYRRLFTRRFLPEATEEQNRWFDELCARTVAPRTAAALIRERGQADARKWLAEIRVPTLVVHARDDQVVPVTDGQEIAAGIPGAEFVQLESCNHILLEHEPAWQRFQAALLAFTGNAGTAANGPFGELSPRELEVLGKLTEGLTNAQIGAALFISEKTVRNQLSRIFAKLGVRNRAQAIVLVRDRGFGGLSETSSAQ